MTQGTIKLHRLWALKTMISEGVKYDIEVGATGYGDDEDPVLIISIERIAR